MDEHRALGSAASLAEKAERDQLAINTIRTLSMDAVQAARSGHPGTPMAMAPVAYLLWNEFLRFDPEDPIWPNRDRFVLSMGHASMLLYSLLHLAQVKAVNAQYERVGTLSVSLEDIKRFRQSESRCPGHPEYRWTSGVETTTGPLGQGYATSVGMAMAAKFLGSTYNRPGFEMFNYRVFALGGDGCMMEGGASEAASLAGHLKLSNLCWIYDNNKITIEGDTEWAFSEDVAARFIAYGWNVMRVSDANDLDRLRKALGSIQRDGRAGPTLLIVDSHIGYGSSKQDSHTAHGEPLGEDVIKDAKAFYRWPENEKFLVPPGAIASFKEGMGARGSSARNDWIRLYERYQVEHPALAEQLTMIQKRRLPSGWDTGIPEFAPDAAGISGRDAGGAVLNAIGKNVPWLVGGAADLSPSTKTRLTFDGAGDFGPSREPFDRHGPRTKISYAGRNMHFGVRELAMGSILNGISLSKARPFGSGFFVFSDFSRPAIRLAALMEIPVIYVFTHDSIGVGEDGPTHQPVEHLLSLRAIPGLIVLRPGDANEVAEAWRLTLTLRHEPACLVLSRQAMPTLDRKVYAKATGLSKGAYVLACAAGSGQPEVILMATGTEVGLAVEAYERLKAEGVRARVVSMPCWELFEKQDRAYKDSVLPPEVGARVSIELGGTLGWERYVGLKGKIMGMTTFGASAPLKELQKKFGFTVDAVIDAARKVMSGTGA